jgi:hypothetical protein
MAEEGQRMFPTWWQLAFRVFTFAAAQSAQRDQVIGGIQPVAADSVQELRGLRRGLSRGRP